MNLSMNYFVCVHRCPEKASGLTRSGLGSGRQLQGDDGWLGVQFCIPDKLICTTLKSLLSTSRQTLNFKIKHLFFLTHRQILNVQENRQLNAKISC